MENARVVSLECSSPKSQRIAEFDAASTNCHLPCFDQMHLSVLNKHLIVTHIHYNTERMVNCLLYNLEIEFRGIVGQFTEDGLHTGDRLSDYFFIVVGHFAITRIDHFEIREHSLSSFLSISASTSPSP